MEMDSKHNSLECKEIFELLSEYIDAELPPELCDAVKNHIEGCDPCVEFVESLQKTVELCQQYRSDVIPPSLAEQVRRELRQAYDDFLSSRKASE
jgi:anti-sigma factor RsiW